MARPVETVSGRHSDAAFAVHETRVDSFEQLRAATPTSSSDIIQIEAGRMRGRLKHASLAGLSLGFGHFSHGLISRGVYSKDRVTIGFLFEGRTRRAGPIGMVRTWSPGTEHQRRYHGGASFGGISVSPDDLSHTFGPDSRLGDPAAWQRQYSFRDDPQTGAAAADAFRSIMSAFESRTAAITAGHAEFWKRAILEAATAAITIADESKVFTPAPRKLVRAAQEVIAQSDAVPIHLSELVTALRVSRRSLHRAFDDVLGISPMKYLRHRRLCEARIMLRERSDPDLTVADVAFRQGFSDCGRFAGYYRALFGENPSDTMRATRPLAR